MNYIDALKRELSTVFTENGDIAFCTSGSYCLDFFSLAGSMRHNYTEALHLFLNAFLENKLLAIKALFYLRDIRGGLGERNTFRFIFNSLCNLYPDVAIQLLEYIPIYGRFDDLFVCINTGVESKMVQMIKKQLEVDLESVDAGTVSLLPKWMPSINTSSKESRALAKKLCMLLNLKEEQYRKMLSKLRKGHVLEVQISNKDYTFDYSKLPSQALLKYRKAFWTHDVIRYQEFISSSINNSKQTLNTSTLFPYQIVSKVMLKECDQQTKMTMEATWKNIDRNVIDSKTIVVLDGSGSMYAHLTPKPIEIAASLAILFSEQLTGPFKNSFITFSHSPALVQLKGETIYEKVQETLSFCEVSNTNISKVFNLIVKTARLFNVPKEEMIERIVIISDMEFDCCVDGLSSFELFKNIYDCCGYDFPEVVFWNVNARGVHVPVTQNENHVKLVSGASKNIIDVIVENKTFNPYEFMISVLEKYSFENLNLS